MIMIIASCSVIAGCWNIWSHDIKQSFEVILHQRDQLTTKSNTRASEGNIFCGRYILSLEKMLLSIVL